MSYALSPGCRTGQAGLCSKGRGPCLLCRRIQTKPGLDGLLSCPALRGLSGSARLIGCGKPAHGSNAKLLGQGGDRLAHGLLGLGHGLASPFGGLLLGRLTVLSLARSVDRCGACNVLSASGGLLQSARLRRSNIKAAKHGLPGNVLRCDARGSKAFLGGAYLTGNGPLSGQHVLTTNVSKGPCAESRFREPRESLSGPRVASRQGGSNVPLGSFDLGPYGPESTLIGLHGLLLVRGRALHDAAELLRRPAKAFSGSRQVRLIIPNAPSSLLECALLKIGKTGDFIAGKTGRLAQGKLPCTLHKRKAFCLNSRVFTIDGCLSLGH